LKSSVSFSLNKTFIVNEFLLLLKSFRAHHWIKNLFLFIPIFFAGEIFNFSKLIDVIVGVIAFCLIASGVYIFNDLFDLKFDRKHPEKSKRPLASGNLSKSTAIAGFITIVAMGLILAYLLEIKFFIMLCIYFAINIAYSIALKNVSILDVGLIAIGFVLRIKAGGALAAIYVTEWLNIMVFLLALFMAMGKRRDDLIIKSSRGTDIRSSINGYNLQFLTTSMTVILSITLVSYLMYMMSPATLIKFGTHRLYYTFLFLMGGVLRYLQIIYLDKKSGSPTLILYKDRFIQVCILLWVISYTFIIYFPDFSILK